MMLADKISASEAERMGMLYKVFSDATFDLETKRLRRNYPLCQQGPRYDQTRAQFSVSNTFEQQLKIEDIYQQQTIETPTIRRCAGIYGKKNPILLANKHLFSL